MSERSRIRPAAAETLRKAVREAGGVEVFAIGDVVDREITEVIVTCRGRQDRVNALIDRPRAGQVVIHNHPTGDLRPSDADMSLAHIYGENGVGFVIIDSTAGRSNWVVEPHRPRAAPVDDAALEAFFTEGLARAMPGWEPRPQQLEMARLVAESLSEEKPLVVEAGTGTGKSLAYLAPAALWATANEAKVAVSTYTRALQTQLIQSDLPLLAAGGIDVSYAVLQGRNNYGCKRRMAFADDEDAKVESRAELDAVLGWARNSSDGLRSEIPFQLDSGLWERVMSDSDLTLSTRCPHYETCFYYTARRKAAAADLLVVNHALLLADRLLVDSMGRGVLPKIARVVLDEAHHLEDAATGAGAHRLTALAVRRAALPLLDSKRRRGALTRVVDKLGGSSSPLPAAGQLELSARVGAATQTLDGLAGTVEHIAEQMAARALPEDGSARRITDDYVETDDWNYGIAPDVKRLSHELVRSTEDLVAIDQIFDDIQLPQSLAEPLLDVRRARRRLGQHAQIAQDFLEPREGIVRWLEPARTRRGDRSAAVCAAPIDVGTLLRRVLWRPLPGAVSTSATLSVNGSFRYWERRHGLTEPETALIPSPFDHANQAILGLPRDIPPPDEPGYMAEAQRITAAAIEISDGGAFVLCTSHDAVRKFARALRDGGGNRLILAQGEIGRSILLDRFRENRRAVLVGTDSFWEGVSVRGEGLRLVVIPRLPFRVPTDPLRQARHEQARANGLDPFKAHSLPEAVIKLRQGYGRLIRSGTDRGAVLILDRRIHDRRYGQVMMRSLPPARRVKAPWRVVAAQLEVLFRGRERGNRPELE